MPNFRFLHQRVWRTGKFFGRFWGCEQTIYNLQQKKSPLTASTHIQMEPTYQILDFHTEGCGVQRVDRKEKKKHFWAVRGVQVPNYRITKNKS